MRAVPWSRARTRIASPAARSIAARAARQRLVELRGLACRRPGPCRSRPPPPPPTTGAASPTTSAAETPRATAALETSATSATFSPSAPPRTIAVSSAELRLDPVGEVEQLLLVGDRGAGGENRQPADRPTASAASRSASSPSCCFAACSGALAGLAQLLGRAAGAGERVLRRAEQLADLAQAAPRARGTSRSRPGR